MNSSPITGEKPSATLEAIKNPVGLLVWGTADLQPTPIVVWIGIGFIAAVTTWLNIFAALNPRFLAYGPREYLRESELAHEREMARLRPPTVLE